MKVTIDYKGEPVGKPMYDLNGERLLKFIEAEMLLGRSVHIHPELKDIYYPKGYQGEA